MNVSGAVSIGKKHLWGKLGRNLECWGIFAMILSPWSYHTSMTEQLLSVSQTPKSSLECCWWCLRCCLCLTCIVDPFNFLLLHILFFDCSFSSCVVLNNDLLLSTAPGFLPIDALFLLEVNGEGHLVFLGMKWHLVIASNRRCDIFIQAMTYIKISFSCL